MSATARSVVYLAAMAHAGPHSRLPIVLVEIIYVTLTAGLYAGVQQRALGLRSKLAGNLVVVFAVPLFAQALDWLAHLAVRAPVPNKATLAVCMFATVSAMFHLHVMRRGAFLTGHAGRTLLDDFRSMPRLTLGFVIAPGLLLFTMAARVARTVVSEAVF